MNRQSRKEEDDKRARKIKIITAMLAGKVSKEEIEGRVWMNLHGDGYECGNRKVSAEELAVIRAESEEKGFKWINASLNIFNDGINT